jgi:hypothetical protein
MVNLGFMAVFMTEQLNQHERLLFSKGSLSKSMIRLRRIAKEMMLALRIARQRSIVTMHRKRLSKT